MQPMKLKSLTRISDFQWRLEPHGRMRVPGVLFASRQLLETMEDKVLDQVANVASLPGIVRASLAMPDAHWGYGFSIGGVAAFDADAGGVISAGGVGFDIACGVRTLRTGLTREAIDEVRDALADLLWTRIPAGVGSTGRIELRGKRLDQMLQGGARWAVEAGYGEPADLDCVEEGGALRGADPGAISSKARQRQQHQLGTLGSGNHYFEVQEVVEVCDADRAAAFGLELGRVVLSIHCGSRGLGHQIATDYSSRMLAAASEHGIVLPERELACAPLRSKIGLDYLGAMRAGANCALANRQVLTHLAREAFAELLPDAELSLLYDVSHNTCKEETHQVEGRSRRLFVHRKGATRAFGSGHPDLPEVYRQVGQPVLVGGSMGTASWILAGTEEAMQLSFGSACHGAGRAMSRNQARKRWKGKGVIHELQRRGIAIRSASLKGVAEEAPGAYKDVDEVIEATVRAGLARKVARLAPLICIKG